MEPIMAGIMAVTAGATAAAPGGEEERKKKTEVKGLGMAEETKLPPALPGIAMAPPPAETAPPPAVPGTTTACQKGL